MKTSSDVIVVGGGPGGASCATALARRGNRVVLLDKDSFPRPHVGESLSPSVLDAARLLGADQELCAAGFAPKTGATFAWGDDPSPWTVDYQEANGPGAYQVRRADFDMILLRAATVAGADVRLGWRVLDIEPALGVVAVAPDGSQERLTAPWVVDASGAARLLSHRVGRTYGPAELDRTAVWGYWRLTGQPVGKNNETSLLVGRRGGCLWHYPLDDQFRLASVGVVVRGSDARNLLSDPSAEFYQSIVDSCPELASRMTGAVLEGGVYAADASASVSNRMAGSGWFLVGDAAFFVDSLLTPGVQVAIESGLLAAQCLQTIIARPDSEPAALELYERVLRREYETFTWLCRNLYRAADTAQGAADPARSQSPEANGQFAFLSLITGLTNSELTAALDAYMGPRAKAVARSGQHMVLGEKEGFAFLAWLHHQDALAEARADRIASELDEGCMLLPAPGMAIAEELFVPSGRAQVLTNRVAIRNRLGDRFEATPGLVTLFETLGNECPYEKAMWRFCAVTDGQRDDCRSRFADWIRLLADYGLVEWKPAVRGVM